MVNITIDGKSIQAEEGRNLIQVAKENGVFIPSLAITNTLNLRWEPVVYAPVRSMESMRLPAQKKSQKDFRLK